MARKISPEMWTLSFARIKKKDVLVVLLLNAREIER